MKHVISILVENKVGVLSRITGLFSGRGFNLESLAVAETENEAISRMTIVVTGDDSILEQVRKQLGKVIDVIKLTDFTDKEHVARDLMLIKVNAIAGKRSEIVELVDVFRGKIIDVGQKDMVVEISGPEERLEAFLNLLRPYGIKEVARTGRIAMSRGPKW
ncbi:MAG: acetolactate synthase small subunit [Candidatus Scalindua sp. AMX11]|nr:MAG: acetolactate synthase small subunit [Candidatus Scalindua sp.]NOG82226.1 acetolactate synthase small subunit [Planctomycetota bacterium]RZV65508.1 MAG: acetolactate synthase small subunit [Candidatus Scalindua sp. SCAELEC01]TDE63388.1 MAG: acetolactate synthase small subunit [Candidatus Scalindua sp. AMX11]GJQ57254.1 MAG: acetolactate synthase small subunit [Candidatus Scalindua sp.]